MWMQRTHLNTGYFHFHNWCSHFDICTSNPHLCWNTAPEGHTGLPLWNQQLHIHLCLQVEDTIMRIYEHTGEITLQSESFVAAEVSNLELWMSKKQLWSRESEQWLSDERSTGRVPFFHHEIYILT